MTSNPGSVDHRSVEAGFGAAARSPRNGASTAAACRVGSRRELRDPFAQATRGAQLPPQWRRRRRSRRQAVAGAAAFAVTGRADHAAGRRGVARGAAARNPGTSGGPAAPVAAQAHGLGARGVIAGPLAPTAVQTASAGFQQQRPIAGESSVALTAITPARPQTPQGACGFGAQLPQMSGWSSREIRPAVAIRTAAWAGRGGSACGPQTRTRALAAAGRSDRNRGSLRTRGLGRAA